MKIALTPTATFALATGVIVVGAYLLTAALRKNKAEMPGAFHVFVSAAGAVAAGGTFLHSAMEATVTPEGGAVPDVATTAGPIVVATAAGCVPTAVSLDETIIFCLGALGIIWCSCQILRREFLSIWD